MKRLSIFTIGGIIVVSGVILFINAAGSSRYLTKIPEQTVLAKQEVLFTRNKNSNKVEESIGEKEKNNIIPSLNVSPQVEKADFEEIYTYLARVMSQEEIDMILEIIDNNNTPASSNNRELSEAEKNRKLILWDEYTYEGLKPEKPMELLNSNNEFYYDSKKDIYNCPKRQLTDEEILQWIDWEYRLEYALSTRTPKIEAEVPDEKDIKETEAIEAAAKVIKQIYDADVSGMLSSSRLQSDFPGFSNSMWLVTFTPYKEKTLRANGETTMRYDVFVDSLTGQSMEVFGYQEPSMVKTVTNTTLKDKRWIKLAEQVVGEKLGKTKEIKAVYVDAKYKQRLKYMYEKKEKGIEERIRKVMSSGLVDVIVELEDKEICYLTFANIDKSIRAVRFIELD